MLLLPNIITRIFSSWRNIENRSNVENYNYSFLKKKIALEDIRAKWINQIIQQVVSTKQSDWSRRNLELLKSA